MAKRKFDASDDDFIFKTLQCAVCNKMLNNPKQLPECGHCFCYTCLLNYSDRERQKLSSSSDQDIASDLPTLVCPSCKFPNELSSRAIEEIPTNVPLLALSHRFRKKFSASAKKKRPSDLELKQEIKTESPMPTPSPLPVQANASSGNLEKDKPAPKLSPSYLPQQPGQAQPSKPEPTKKESPPRPSAVSCCTNSSAQKKTLCKHCSEYFCERCEIIHLQVVRAEISTLGKKLEDRMSQLPNTQLLGTSADEVYNKLTLDLQEVEKAIQTVTTEFYMMISKALEKNSIELVEDANQLVSEETQRIARLVEKWSRQEWRTDVMKQVRDACREIVVRPLLKRSLDAVSPIHVYLSKLKDDVESVEKMCRPVPIESQLAFLVCDHFSEVANSLGTTLPIGTIKNSINKLPEHSPTTSNEGQSSPNASITPRPSATPAPSLTQVQVFDKSFYQGLAVCSVIQTKDKLGWELKKPTACCVLMLPEPVAIILHNGTRITTVNAHGEMTASYRVRMHPSEKENYYLGQTMAAADDGTIFLVSHYQHRILYLKYHEVKDPKNAYARVLVRRPDCEQFTTFNALAVSSQRRELYTSTRDSIIAYFIKDGTESFRCAFRDDSHIGTSLLRTVFTDEESNTILVYTSMNGRVAYSLRLPGAGSLDKDEQANMLPLSKQIKTSLTSPNRFSLPNAMARHIQYLTTDPGGNFLVSLSNKSKSIMVFERNSEEPLTEFSACGLESGDFDPSQFVVLPGENPVVVLSCFNSSQIVVLKPKKQ